MSPVQTKKPFERSAGAGLRYQQAMAFVEHEVKSGKLFPGQKLPPMKELSQKLGMNFQTLRRALIELEEKGVVNIRHGSGTFISDHPLGSLPKTIKIGLGFGSYMLDGHQQHPALGAYLVGANQRCPGPAFIVQPIFYDTPFAEKAGHMLLHEKVSGLVVLDGRLDEEDIEFLCHYHIPVVYRSFQPLANEWAITVAGDRLGALSQAVEHLRSLGHRRIAFIYYTHSADGSAIQRHFVQLAFDHRLGDPNELIILVRNPSHDVHMEDVEKFFALSPLPTGVIVGDELQADILLDGCERRGIKVPNDLSIVTLQDALPLGHRVPLTAANTAEELQGIAALACDLLVRRIRGQAIEKNHFLLPPRLVAKASTGPSKGPS